MPSSASSSALLLSSAGWSRAEEVVHILGSMDSAERLKVLRDVKNQIIWNRTKKMDSAERLKALRDVKNQIIGNRTKKMWYIKFGAIPCVVDVLAFDSEVSIVISQNQKFALRETDKKYVPLHLRPKKTHAIRYRVAKLQIIQQMQIPLSYADDVIGSDGRNISYIRHISGATVTVQETRGTPGDITIEIKGTESQAQTAQQLIIGFHTLLLLSMF